MLLGLKKLCLGTFPISLEYKKAKPDKTQGSKFTL